MKRLVKFALLIASSSLLLASCSFLNDLIPSPDSGSTSGATSGDTKNEFAFNLSSTRLSTGDKLTYSITYGPYRSISVTTHFEAEYLTADPTEQRTYIATSASGYTDFDVRVKDSSTDTTIFEKTYSIAVNLVAVESVRFIQKDFAVKTNNEYEMEYEILPAGANYKSLEFSTSDESKIEITGNKIKTKADGDSVLTLTVVDGEDTFTDTCNVSSVFQPLTGIEFADTSLNISQGFETPVAVNLIPSDASVKDFTLTSSNSSVVSVVNGKLLGKVISGSATITVTSGDFSDTLLVTVVGIAKADRVDMAEGYYEMDTSPSNSGTTQSIGTAKLLVVPIWFTDSSSYITSSGRANVYNDITECYLGDTKSNGWRSVKNYYYDESNHLCNLDITIASWYNVSYASSHYYTDKTATYNLVSAALDYHLSESGESKTVYDANGDGTLDGILLIYAAPDKQARVRVDSIDIDTESNMWAYCAHRSGERNVADPALNVYFWASYDFMYDSTLATSRTGSSYWNGHSDGLGSLDSTTFIHEMGHMFGLDDYYDYKHLSDPAGSYTMQDHDTGGHDPYSLLALGWAKAYIPDNSCTITLDDVYKEHEVIILTPSWNAYNSPFDEYLILELYSPTGLNEHDQSEINVPNVGVRVWHVDARLLYRTGSMTTDNIVKTTTTHPGYAFTHLQTNDSYDGSNASSFPLGIEYADYNLLQLIRKSGVDTYKPAIEASTAFRPTSLFYAGESFSMEAYKAQFKNSTKLNSGVDLGWSFHVDAIDDVELKAVITLTKS